MIELNEEFAAAWAGRDPMTEAFRLDGEVYRAVKNRRTFRFELNDKGYFAKLHYGVGWRETIKNLIQYKLPIFSARREYDAIRRLESLGVATMKIAAFGEENKSLVKRRSFIITEELVDTINLEAYCEAWPEHPPAFGLKRALIIYIAETMRTLHENGVNHRDCYICHFHFDVSRDWREGVKAALIDLHRAQLRDETPRRWIVKDLAGLYFSVMKIGLTQRDLYRFMKTYRGQSLRKTLRDDASLWQSVDKAAHRLYAREQRNPKG